MLALVNSSRCGKLMCQRIGQCRTVICTPPRVRVSFPEKVAHGVAIFLGILAIPAYVAVNLKNYRPKGD